MLQMHIGILNSLDLIVFKYFDYVFNNITIIIDAFFMGYMTS